MRRRWAGGNGDVDVSNPFLFHQRPAVLSVQAIVSCSCMLKQSAMYAWWSTLSASSRLLLVTWPSGLPQDTIPAVMSAGKFACSTMGCAPAGSGYVAAALGCGWGFRGTRVGPKNTSPPHIYLEAPWQPSRTIWGGTSSYRLFGRLIRSSASHRNSAKTWWMPLVSATRFPFMWRGPLAFG